MHESSLPLFKGVVLEFAEGLGKYVNDEIDEIKKGAGKAIFSEVK